MRDIVVQTQCGNLPQVRQKFPPVIFQGLSPQLLLNSTFDRANLCAGNIDHVYCCVARKPTNSQSRPV